MLALDTSSWEGLVLCGLRTRNEDQVQYINHVCSYSASITTANYR